MPALLELRVTPRDAGAARDTVVGRQLGVVLLQKVQPRLCPLYTIVYPTQPLLPLAFRKRTGGHLGVVAHPVEPLGQLHVTLVVLQVFVVVPAEHLDRSLAQRTCLPCRRPPRADIVVGVRMPHRKTRLLIFWRGLRGV